MPGIHLLLDRVSFCSTEVIGGGIHRYFCVFLAMISIAEGNEQFSDAFFFQLSFVYEVPGRAEETCSPCLEEAGCEHRKRRRLQP